MDKPSTGQMYILSFKVTFQEISLTGTCIINVQERWKPRECLRKGCCHRIKYFAVNFLVTLMWRRLLNSAALTTPTHRGPRRVSDGTST